MRNVCSSAELRTCLMFRVQTVTATRSASARTRAANAYTKRGIENSFLECLCMQGTKKMSSTTS